MKQFSILKNKNVSRETKKPSTLAGLFFDRVKKGQMINKALKKPPALDCINTTFCNPDNYLFYFNIKKLITQ